MKEWLKDRFSSPNTWIAVSLLMQAIGIIGKVNEAPVIADAVASAAGPLSAGDYSTASVAIGSAVLGLILKEKK